ALAHRGGEVGRARVHPAVAGPAERLADVIAELRREIDACGGRWKRRGRREHADGDRVGMRDAGGEREHGERYCCAARPGLVPLRGGLAQGWAARLGLAPLRGGLAHGAPPWIRSFASIHSASGGNFTLALRARRHASSALAWSPLRSYAMPRLTSASGTFPT